MREASAEEVLTRPLSEVARDPSGLQQLLLERRPWPRRQAVGLRSDLGVRWWTSAEFERAIYELAVALRAAGVGPRVRVGIWADNSPECLAALFATLVRGAVAVPISAGADPEAVAAVLDELGVAVLLHGQRQSAAVWRGRSLLLSAAASTEGADTWQWSSVLCAVTAEAPAALLHTSGTTGELKTVVLDHGNLLSQVQGIAWSRSLVRLLPTRLLVLSPLSHVQGLLMGGLVPALHGVSVLYCESSDPWLVMRSLRAHRVTLLLAVPAVQHALIECLRRLPSGRGTRTIADEEATTFFPLRRHRLFLATRRRLGWRFSVLLVGGAALSRADERFWFDAGYCLVQGYGLTETTALVAYAINHPFRWRGGSLGRPIQGAEVVVAEDGELLVKGRMVSRSLGLREGVLHTGDFVKQDRSGRLFFEGRKKDLIVTSEGENVQPLVVERALHRVAGVRDALVFGLVRSGREEVHAALLLSAGGAGDIVARANQSLQPHERVTSWTEWSGPDFPRGALGKPLRAAVRSAIERASASAAPADRERPATRDSHDPAALEAPSAALKLNEIRDIPERDRRIAELARALRQGVAGTETLTPRVLGDEFGLNSLDQVALWAAVERDTGGIDRLTRLPLPLLGPVTAAALGYPAWAQSPPVAWFRRLVAPWLIALFAACFSRIRVRGRERLRGLRGPFVVVGFPHENGMDVMSLYRAMPFAVRHRLMFLGSEWVFRERADRDVVWWRRWLIGFAAHALIPVFLPFALFPRDGNVRETFLATAEMMDRGLNPILFPQGDPFRADLDRPLHAGLGHIAAATGATIVVAVLSGNADFRYFSGEGRGQITVEFADPIAVRTGSTPEDVCERVRASLVELYGAPRVALSDVVG